MLHQDLEQRPSMALDKVRPRGPTPSNRQDTFSKVEWMHENPSRLPLVRRVPTLNVVNQSPDVPSGEKEETVRERVPVSASSSTTSSSDDSASHDSDFNNIPSGYENIPAFHLQTSDNTIHFSLDIADDIEGHLEEVSRLRRWGHFKEANEYFAETLEHHLDLPRVALEYADLLVDQGSYQEFNNFVSDRPWKNLDQKKKCLPIKGVEAIPNLYQLHSQLLEMRGKLSFVSLAVNDLDLIQTDSFCEYLDKRAASRHGENHSPGSWLPFDSTEVQIIRNQLELRSDIRCKGKTPMSAFDTRCWPELYNDLLMDGRIWELSDLLLAMFHFFGLSGTWERLFNLDEKKKKSKDSQTIHCLERLLEDWTIDEYDEATELAVLTIIGEMVYMLDIGSQSLSVVQKDRTLTLARCKQQAEQCAADIKEYSPHLMNTRPYLQWILAKEHFDRQQHRSPLYREQRKQWIERTPGLVLNKWCLPVYIPVATENPGWPALDPEFPPNESLQWALRTSKELSDYKTQAMLLEELICRVEDPRPLFNELDQLYGHAQGDLIQFYESLASQYLLTTDDDSSWVLLQRLKAAALEFKPAPKDDVCAATRWNGLGVQNALARSISEDAELLEQNSELTKTLSEALPYSQKAIDKFAKSSIDENRPSNVNVNGNDYADHSKETGFFARANPSEHKPKQFDEVEYFLDSPGSPDPHEARGQVNDRFTEDISHRLHKLELELLKYKRQALEKELHDALEKELHDVRSRLELKKFENKERPRAKKEEIRKPREDTSGSGPGFLIQGPLSSPKISYNQKNRPVGEQGNKKWHKVEFRQPEDNPVEDIILLTHEPEEINYDTPAHENNDHQMSEKPSRYASVAEPQDEPTMLGESDQGPADPSLSEARDRQTPELQPENSEPQVTAELSDHVVVEKSIGKESVHSAEGSEAMPVHVREEVPSEDEIPSKPPSSLGRSSGRDSHDLQSAEGSEAMPVHVRGEVPSEDERPSRPLSSLGRSSRHDSQDSENRSIRMIGYTEEILD